MTTKTIFKIMPKNKRLRSSPTVIAIFPELPGTNNPYTCTCYMHLGQHGAIDLDLVSELSPATPEQYKDLLEELQSIGYEDIAIYHRVSQKMTETRLENLQDI